MKTAARLALQKIIISGDKAMYFPKTPEVLINSVAKNKRDTLFICALTIVSLKKIFKDYL